MRVICIDDFTIQIGAEGNFPAPIVGEKCHVIREVTYCGYRCYELAEYPPANGHQLLYQTEGFVLLSDIDERDRLEAWQEDRLTQEDKMLQALAECMPKVEMPRDSFERVWKNINAAL